MIKISGRTSSEYDAAEALKKLIVEAWPDVHKRHTINIVAGAKCHGQEIRDVDLMVFADLQEGYTITSPNNNSEKIEIVNFCLVIEVKDHSPENVRFEGTRVEVRYHQKWHDVTEQSHGQMVSVKNYLESNGISPQPYIINAIWLRNIPTSGLPDQQHNVLGGDATWLDFVKKMILLKEPQINRYSGKLELRSSWSIPVNKATAPFFKETQPSILDRQKMERITKSFLAEQKYADRLGDQLLVFRGKGGTGKTVRLLQLAHDLYENKGARVLILTYNAALASDLERLLALMNIKDGIAAKSVRVQTVHSFLYHLLDGLDILPHSCRDFLEKYEHYKSQALELMAAVNQKDVDQLIQRNRRAFNWDYIFIDESQDWPSDERDILFSVYDYQQFVLADGVDQLVRRYNRIDWRETLERDNTQVVPLHKVLRLKVGLCRFVKCFARHINLDDSDIEPHLDVNGGHIIIVEGGDGIDRELHNEILGINKRNGNSPVDMLFCVPPKLVNIENEKRYSVIGSRFREWGYEVWDGTAEDVRHSYPTKLEQHRIVQYDSCRGLEGWIVVNLQFDQFFDYKVATYTPTPDEEMTLFFDREHEANLYALRWLMIPLTRAIDTLVIHVSDPNHYLTGILRSVAQEYSDIVTWRQV